MAQYKKVTKKVPKLTPEQAKAMYEQVGSGTKAAKKPAKKSK